MEFRKKTHRAGHAAVVGAGMAGLLMARVASAHFERVTVIERDRMLEVPSNRRGVPQGRHAHALLAAGERSIERLFPGLVASLTDSGAVVASPPNTIRQHVSVEIGDLGPDVRSVFATRPLIEHAVRRRVIADDRVEMLEGWALEGLQAPGPGAGITGVVIGNGETCETLATDLVVDCSGREARTLGHLQVLGHRLPPMSSIRVDIGYATVVVEREPGDLGGLSSLLTTAEAPSSRGAAVLPIEGRRWIVTQAGSHGDHPPTDPDGYLAFATTLLSPYVAEVLGSRENGKVMTYRFRSSQRRHFEKWRNPVPGHLVAGDGICSFNPIYGQGMSSAALQAEAFDDVLARHGFDHPRLAPAFYRRASAVVNNPWMIAATRDFMLPGTTGDKPPGTDLINAYLSRYERATLIEPALAAQMVRVQNLLASPRSLMRPDRALRVFRLAGSRRSALTPTPTAEPVRA